MKSCGPFSKYLDSTHLRKDGILMSQIQWLGVQKRILHEQKGLWPLEFSCEAVWMGEAPCSLVGWQGSPRKLIAYLSQAVGILDPYCQVPSLGWGQGCKAEKKCLGRGRNWVDWNCQEQAFFVIIKTRHVLEKLNLWERDQMYWMFTVFTLLA